MSILYKENVIKSQNVRVKGILTFSDINQSDMHSKGKKSDDYVTTLVAKRDSLLSEIEELEKKKESLIKSTEEEVNSMLKKAEEEVATIERKAYTEGHAQGLSNGYEDGYKEAYDDNIEKAKLEAEEIVSNASNVMLEANKTVYDYLTNSKQDILELCVKMVSKVLREEFQNPYVLSRLVEKALNEYKYKENCVVRVNKEYVQVLNTKLPEWKSNNHIDASIFVVEDNNVEVGNAVIVSDKGKVEIGIDTALERLKYELL